MLILFFGRYCRVWPAFERSRSHKEAGWHWEGREKARKGRPEHNGSTEEQGKTIFTQLAMAPYLSHAVVIIKARTDTTLLDRRTRYRNIFGWFFWLLTIQR